MMAKYNKGNPSEDRLFPAGWINESLPRQVALKSTTLEKESTLKKLRDQFIGTEAETQAKLMLEALRLFPVTTFEASRFLDIYHPAGRVKELREQGHKINTLRTYSFTEAGVKHCIGKYVLLMQS